MLWPRGHGVVTQEDAVEAYRNRTDVTTSTGGSTGEASIPELGVYSYAASGSEAIKIAVLPTEHRTYPELITTTVVAGEKPGCFTVKLSLLAEHTEDSGYCSDADGALHLVAHRKHQRVGALEPVADMNCTDDLLIDAEGRGAELHCALALDAGPTSMSADVAGTSKVGADTVTVDGVDVPATTVDVTYEITGDLSGTWSEKLWLADDTRLPLRIERRLDLSGLAKFSETSDLRLLDLSPTR